MKALPFIILSLCAGIWAVTKTVEVMHTATTIISDPVAYAQQHQSD